MGDFRFAKAHGRPLRLRGFGDEVVIPDGSSVGIIPGTIYATPISAGCSYGEIATPFIVRTTGDTSGIDNGDGTVSLLTPIRFVVVSSSGGVYCLDGSRSRISGPAAVSAGSHADMPSGITVTFSPRPSPEPPVVPPPVPSVASTGWSTTQKVGVGVAALVVLGGIALIVSD